MAAKPSDISGHRRERNRSRSPWVERPAPISANTTHAPAIYSSNSNQNTVYGSANIFNSNPNFNFQSAVVHYNLDSSDAPNASSKETQAKITAALKERHTPNALYDAQIGSGCMHGTRVQIFRDIEKWFMDPDSQQIFWLTGMAGTGKSAIAWTVCSCADIDINMILGGSFFCSRSSGWITQRDVRCVIPTLAQLLSRQSTEFGEALAAELDKDPDILHKQIAVQVKKLLYAPLLAIRNHPGPILFVIDGLDECGNPGTPGGEEAHSRRLVVEMIEALVSFARSDTKLPVKFLITSRPETHIRDTPVSDATFANILRLHTVSKYQVEADIRLYVSNTVTSSPRLRNLFTDYQVNTLARLCDGLFIIAKTALDYILVDGIDCAATMFEALLRHSGNGLSDEAAAPLDRMYTLILEGAARFNTTKTGGLPEMLDLLATLLSARDQLSLTALADLLSRPKEHVRAGLSRLHAVVHVPEDDDEQGLRTLHASFGDYLIWRAPEYLRIAPSLGNEILARGCLRVMSNGLYFNISQSGSSYEKRRCYTRVSITNSVQYACTKWIYHIGALPVPSMLDEEINHVFRPRFLFWLEVMSVSGNIRPLAISMMLLATSIVQLTELSLFLRDAHAFVVSSEDAIQWGAPHIYVSALPFAAKDSLVYKTFAPLCTGLISVETFGIKRHSGGLITVLNEYFLELSSVAYSSDGRLIGTVTGKEIKIWDTRTGDETLPRLEDCYAPIKCIAFSPKGNIIAAGTEDGGICTWSLLERGASLQRWSDSGSYVISLSFAPDGVRLASAMGSLVSLWQVQTGDLTMELNGHTGDVSQVAFSPDGATLASCSHDATIQLWHIYTCQPLRHTLRGHEDKLHVVCFSHDGSRLASGSLDGTVQLWDTQSRTVVATLNKHSRDILSIRFLSGRNSLIWITKCHGIHRWNPFPTGDMSSIEFPTSNHILSCASFPPEGLNVATVHLLGYFGYTWVKIWDVEKRQQALHALPAHKKTINSVAVSSDSKFIVSGSDDCSVRVWNADTGNPRLAPLMEPTQSVRIVTISPNGQMVAAASLDYDIWIWNAQTGETIGDPLRGHEREVTNMAFSFDSHRLLSVSSDSSLCIWEASTGQLVKTHLLSGVESMNGYAFSPCGRIVAASADSLIHLWHTDTGQTACEPLQANICEHSQIWFSPNGYRVAFLGSDYMVHVWGISVRRLLYVLKKHDTWAKSVAHSSDGRLICSASYNGPVHLSNASDGTFIATLNDYVGFVQSVVFTPDGQSIVSHCSKKAIRIWDVKAACLKPEGGNSDPVATLAFAGLGPEMFEDAGWLLGSSLNRLLWVPEEYRPYLQIPPCKLVIGKYRVVLRVDESGWHHGENWTLCWKPNLLSPGLT